MLSFLLLVIGFILLIIGANLFVTSASKLATKLKIPSLIIGLTIVAFGTSAPELAVSLSASLSGSNDLVIGNVIGSNLFNLLIVVGICCIIKPLTVEKKIIKRDWPLAILSTFMLIIFILFNSNITRFESFILISIFIIVMIIQIKTTKKESIIKKESYDSSIKLPIIIPGILLGITLIICGGQLSVHGATVLATKIGLSEGLIGLTIVAVGTSLPELVTSLVATKKGESSIAIGNVIGSNLFNILIILGTTCFINPIKISGLIIIDVVILLLLTCIIFWFAKKGKLNRLFGSVLVWCYISYTIYIVFR